MIITTSLNIAPVVTLGHLLKRQSDLKLKITEGKGHGFAQNLPKSVFHLVRCSPLPDLFQNNSLQNWPTGTKELLHFLFRTLQPASSAFFRFWCNRHFSIVENVGPGRYVECWSCCPTQVDWMKVKPAAPSLPRTQATSAILPDLCLVLIFQIKLNSMVEKVQRVVESLRITLICNSHWVSFSSGFCSWWSAVCCGWKMQRSPLKTNNTWKGSDTSHPT